MKIKQPNNRFIEIEENNGTCSIIKIDHISSVNFIDLERPTGDLQIQYSLELNISGKEFSLLYTDKEGKEYERDKEIILGLFK